MYRCAFDRGGVYSRYTEGDWDTSNKNYFYLADKERSSAERLRADTWQLVVGAEDRTRNRQANNTKKLGRETVCSVKKLINPR